MVAVRLYVRYNLSCRDVEELLLERGVEVDHVTVFRWVQRFTPILAAARFRRHAPGDRWFTDETYVKVRSTEVITDAAPVYPAVLDELVPSAWHHIERHANNRIEADHSQLKHRLRPMRGLQTDRTAQTIIVGHAFMQNLRRGHYQLGLDAPCEFRVAAAFVELTTAI